MNFLFQKNKMKVGFGCEKAVFWKKYGNCRPKLFFWSAIKIHETTVFQGANMVKIFSSTPAFTPLFGLCFVHIYSMSDFLKNAPQGKILGEIAAKIAQKTKFLEENAAKIVLFEKKTFLIFD
jgi:hypothetical protein